MSGQPKRKVTYSLPERLIDEIASVVREGAAPSYSAFVEHALEGEIRRTRERNLADAFKDAASDSDFLADIDDTMESYRHIDDEPSESSQ